METTAKQVTLNIIDGKFTSLELQNLLQLIAQELKLQTTSNYAKENKLSFNGVKNFRPHILIDGIKFHSDGIIENSLPF
ncbi:hypothetical protein Phi13:2_gp037 [Cellulophaga phage phi13:2]|uniref:Uncharacterized protein n=4 Tax=Pachyviridae TaxID=2946166 RepID=S0A311_9CAUD|nr:hypothetical protein Phi19:3_gp035 [Cellulophaga phage phi19:3]YP_008241076.1 hypothetical protein Phi46:3_gp033 [Cellulophaga phage phi46:3]YP_008241229.1 hypothetical protein Phi18:3_gp036 [Cellulophaga phage phi18:3]YP_008242062.1 hypothetical protein Phi13:2_gp037 [Cellulophaga phage phi13:2]AGO47439.1 hypothetical protein Phi19:3_gp035 [Cellulophaga phage phi19:3]AGO48548.1 hypothetical protein Phi18:3_gp036 [Cellulophaga phage phi18:3]AGO48777.1 hypothetical protein Phi46:3_gp033 [Ce